MALNNLSVRRFILFVNQLQYDISQFLLSLQQIQMSQAESDNKKQKTKEEYSRNVKKLKIKLTNTQNQIATLQKKISTLTNTSNDKIISMKIAKFCKERRFTPEMLFRFADKTGKKNVSKLEFEQTLKQLGLKLTKEELMRLQYLIDEDLSGVISFAEYNTYLDTFGIKKEYSATEKTVKDVLKKIGADMISKMDDEGEGGSKKKKHAQMLNYEQFLKYCHRHFPGLTDKEQAAIFNRLQRNNLINLQDLKDYLNDQQEQRKKIEQKNRQKQKKDKDKEKKNQKKQSQPAPVLQSSSLKSILKALLKYRGKSDSLLFFSSEFFRLQKLLNKKKGELANLFKEIDQKRKGSFKGSFSFNQLITYFIQKEEKSRDVLYCFQLMGKKLQILHHSPEAVISQYAQSPTNITEAQFSKFMRIQFQIQGRTYDIVSKLVPREQDNSILIENLVNLITMSNQNRRVYIRPDIITTRLVFRNGINALECCIQLVDKLQKAKIAVWNDYEFGPTQADQNGMDSINLPMPSQSIEWMRVTDLGMSEFWKPDSKQTVYTHSPSCPNQTFISTLYQICNTNSSTLWTNTKIDYNIRDIEQPNLNCLFKGLYPLVFHSFSKFGIFVFKFFVGQKWKYVIVDDKIPCTGDRIPYFASVANMRYSYLSLIEKAYAKLQGNYQNIYKINNLSKYILELTNSIAFQQTLSKNMAEKQKEEVWNCLSQFKKQASKNDKKDSSKKQQTLVKLEPIYCISPMKKQGERLSSGIPTDIPFKIQQVVELQDSQCKNKHKSHRLLLIGLLKTASNQRVWNSQWNQDQQHNKYKLYEGKPQLLTKLNNSEILKDNTVLLLNYKLFRQIFSLYHIQKVDLATMVVLRKQLQFQQKFKCRYELSSKQSLRLNLVLTETLPSQSKINLDIRNQKQQLISQQSTREQTFIYTYQLIPQQPIRLQLYIDNWKPQSNHSYNLTFYMQHSRYELKQRDRHMLFQHISPYDEQPKLNFSDFSTPGKQFIYKNFYRAAQRRGCCGCL